MKKYHLELNDVNDFIPELAKKLGIDYINNLSEYSLVLPKENIGEGSITGINFPNGVGLYTYYCEFKEDIHFEITNSNINPLRFFYCLEGSLSSSFNGEDGKVIIKHHQHLISAPLKDESQSISFSKNTPIAVCYLEINRVKFQQYLSFNLNEVEPIFYKIFSDLNARNRICEIGKFSIKIADVIKEIKKCKLTGFPRVNFVGAKALEVLSYMLDRFKKEEYNFFQKNLREKDIKATEKVLSYLDENISTSATVRELAGIAGLNSNKLQEVFKLLYGKTVNEYIRDIRLTKALDLLSSGKKNVSEVVYEMGLSSRSYFSKIFKAKYGVSPREVLSKKS